MSSNFIFSENDVGKNRALASLLKLQELNNAVVVSTLTTKLTKEHLSDFQVLNVIIIDHFLFHIHACSSSSLALSNNFL